MSAICKKECQHAVDVGLWPQHRCVGVCYYAALEKTYVPCGGCGAETPADRCMGCLHDFTNYAHDISTPNWGFES